MYVWTNEFKLCGINSLDRVYDHKIYMYSSRSAGSRRDELGAGLGVGLELGWLAGWLGIWKVLAVKSGAALSPNQHFM